MVGLSSFRKHAGGDKRGQVGEFGHQGWEMSARVQVCMSTCQNACPVFVGISVSLVAPPHVRLGRRLFLEAFFVDGCLVTDFEV